MFRERRENMMGARDGGKAGSMRGVGPRAVDELVE